MSMSVRTSERVCRRQNSQTKSSDADNSQKPEESAKPSEEHHEGHAHVFRKTWQPTEINLFIKGVQEHGKDFRKIYETFFKEAASTSVEAPNHNERTEPKIRNFYFKLLGKLLPYIDLNKIQRVKSKQAKELYILLCYFELWKMFGDVFNSRLYQHLRALVYNGQCICKFTGKKQSVTVRPPMCPAMRSLKNSVPPRIKLSSVNVWLEPSDHQTFGLVQNQAKNPCVMLTLSPNVTISQIKVFLQHHFAPLELLALKSGSTPEEYDRYLKEDIRYSFDVSLSSGNASLLPSVSLHHSLAQRFSKSTLHAFPNAVLKSSTDETGREFVEIKNPVKRKKALFDELSLAEIYFLSVPSAYGTSGEPTSKDDDASASTSTTQSSPGKPTTKGKKKVINPDVHNVRLRYVAHQPKYRRPIRSVEGPDNVGLDCLATALQAAAELIGNDEADMGIASGVKRRLTADLSATAPTDFKKPKGAVSKYKRSKAAKKNASPPAIVDVKVPERLVQFTNQLSCLGQLSNLRLPPGAAAKKAAATSSKDASGFQVAQSSSSRMSSGGLSFLMDGGSNMSSSNLQGIAFSPLMRSPSNSRLTGFESISQFSFGQNEAHLDLPPLAFSAMPSEDVALTPADGGGGVSTQSITTGATATGEQLRVNVTTNDLSTFTPTITAAISQPEKAKDENDVGNQQKHSDNATTATVASLKVDDNSFSSLFKSGDMSFGSLLPSNGCGGLDNSMNPFGTPMKEYMPMQTDHSVLQTPMAAGSGGIGKAVLTLDNSSLFDDTKLKFGSTKDEMTSTPKQRVISEGD